MAVNEEGGDDGVREFLAGGTPTPIDNGSCVPITLLEQIVIEHLNTGVRPKLTRWEGV